MSLQNILCTSHTLAFYHDVVNDVIVIINVNRQYLTIGVQQLQRVEGVASADLLQCSTTSVCHVHVYLSGL